MRNKKFFLSLNILALVLVVSDCSSEALKNRLNKKTKDNISSQPYQNKIESFDVKSNVIQKKELDV